MNFGMVMVVIGYIALIASFGWVGVLGAAIHIGLLLLAAHRRK